jgi:hypothetical protein
MPASHNSKRNARSNKSSRQQSPRTFDLPLPLTQPRDVEPAVERLVDLAFTVDEPLIVPPSPAQYSGLNWDVEFTGSSDDRYVLFVLSFSSGYREHPLSITFPPVMGAYFLV